MRTSKTLLAALVLGILMLGNLEAQQYKFFLNIDGLVGESTTEGHLGEINAVSYKAGVTQKLLSTFAGGAAKPVNSDFKPVTIYKFLDSTTPTLFVACAVGTHFKTATLTINNPQRSRLDPLADFFKIVLSDVVIASVNQDSDTQDSEGTLVESITLSYTKIQWIYTPQKPTGEAGEPITGGYDIKLNKKL